MRIGFLVITALTLLGCGREGHFQQKRWSSVNTNHQKSPGYGQQSEAVEILKKQVPVVNIGGEDVIRTQQTVEGFPVEGTWLQEVLDADGEVKSLTYNLLEGFPKAVIRSAKEIAENKASILEVAKGYYPSLSESSQVFQSQVVLVPDAWTTTPYLKVVFLAPDEQSVLSYYLNAVGRVKKTKEYQHNFTNGVGFVFYSSPDESEVSEQTLKGLKGDGSLASQHLSVESAIKPTPVSEDHVFKYALNEREFDLLQSYFFVDQTIQWFSEQLNTSLGYPLSIKVHIGGLKPTNAAFFYAGKIRLGEGDGKIYKSIPRDPSIVTHEASHAFVEKLSGLGFEDEAGSYSEAFSDFFTAARLGRPEMGFYSYLKAPFKRTIDNDFRADRDLRGKKYNDSLIVSATFWDIKKILGTEKATMLAKAFLIELGPGGKLLDLPEVLTSVTHQHLPSEDHHVVESVLEQRGWRSL